MNYNNNKMLENKWQQQKIIKIVEKTLANSNTIV